MDFRFSVQLTSSIRFLCESGKSRGFGFLNFNSSDEAKAAVEQIDGGCITLRPKVQLFYFEILEIPYVYGYQITSSHDRSDLT
ncbi:hypothetical protein U9M48_039554 [Paspalum notatum var. saurae]|uniref:RRM domain-containing protein n=1 Tax=Paspalum notatum var. saurae TaxID=547442 RepID=A0AAQ3UK94_PASNO